MANYSYETLQRMSAHPWEGLKPGQRKAVRNFNRKEGVSEPDMLEAERLLETNPNMSMDEALGKVTSPAYKAASADTKERIAELRKAATPESEPAKPAKQAKPETKPKRDVAELVGEVLNPKPADGVTGPDWQWLDQLPVDHAPVPSQGVYIALATAMRVNPGMWTRMRAYVRSDRKRGRRAARALANRVNSGGIPSMRPKGSYEAAYRTLEDGSSVCFARYVGEGE